MQTCERNIEMYFEEINPMSRKSAERAFAQNNVEKIEEALLRMTFHDEDWHLVQSYCLQFLNYPNKDVRNTAALCLGHLACIHLKVDTYLVVPALKALLSDPEVAKNASDALDDIALFVRQAGVL